MPEPNNLVIFIDGFPFSHLKFASHLAQIPHQAQVIPGLGYSVNVKGEIFGGYLPDQMGWFNEWGYHPKASLRKYAMLFAACAVLPWNSFLDRVAHKVLSKMFRRNLVCIPFQYLRFFEKHGVSAYEDNFPLLTVFSGVTSLKKSLYSHYPASSNRDEQVFFDARDALLSGNFKTIFAPFGELDTLTHEYGVGSKEHLTKISDLDAWINELIQRLHEKNSQGKFVIISDHGMVDVSQTVTLDLEHHFGTCGESSYLYFIDSTMLRVWIFDDSLQSGISNYLGNIEGGQILDFDLRKRYGVASPEFGDLFFVLDEGVVFHPSFMGRGLPKAMHGYLPEFLSQAGIFLHNIPGLNLHESVTTLDVFQTLKSLLAVD